MQVRPGVLRHKKTLVAQAQQILRKYSGSLWLPSAATCFQDSGGVTPGAQDQPVGLMRDLVGTLHATQATAGYKPILRKGSVNALSNTAFTVGIVDGTPGTPPTNFGCTDPSAYGITRTISHGTDSDGRYIELRFAGTNSSGAPQYPSGLVSHYLQVPAPVGSTVQLRHKIKLVAGAWPTGSSSCNCNLWENNNVGAYLTSQLVFQYSAATAPLGVLVDVVSTKVLGNASTAFLQYILLNHSLAVGATVDHTVRIYEPVVTIGADTSTASHPVNDTAARKSNGVGSYWLDFDGADDRLALPSAIAGAADDVTASCVFRNVTSAGATAFGVGGSSTISNTAVLRLGAVSATCQSLILSRDDANSASVFLAGPSNDAGSLVTITGQKAGTSYTARRNGAQYTTGVAALGTTTADVAELGRMSAAAGTPLKGGLHGAFVCKAIPSAAELKILERAMSNLSGVSLA